MVIRILNTSGGNFDSIHCKIRKEIVQKNIFNFFDFDDFFNMYLHHTIWLDLDIKDIYAWLFSQCDLPSLEANGHSILGRLYVCKIVKPWLICRLKYQDTQGIFRQLRFVRCPTFLNGIKTTWCVLLIPIGQVKCSKIWEIHSGNTFSTMFSSRFQPWLL